MVYLYIFSAILCIDCAFYLLLKGIDGWGWFLLVALIVLGSINYTSKSTASKPEEDDNE